MKSQGRKDGTMKGMTNAQYDAFLETLARLVEKAKSVEEAAQIIRDAKIQKEEEADTPKKM